jgi:hypothetical protein
MVGLGCRLLGFRTGVIERQQESGVCERSWNRQACQLDRSAGMSLFNSTPTNNQTLTATIRTASQLFPACSPTLDMSHRTVPIDLNLIHNTINAPRRTNLFIHPPKLVLAATSQEGPDILYHPNPSRVHNTLFSETYPKKVQQDIIPPHHSST